MPHKMRHLAILLAILVLSSCSNEEWGSSKYSNKRARFSCPSVTSVAPLYAAVNNPGIWCTVRLDNSGRRYQFDAPGMTMAYWNITASISDQYHTWVSGLIIGTPSYPEPGAIATIPTCYDLVCPTCYNIPLDRQLTITSTGYAECERCHSRYDLNNQGFIVSGDEGATSRLLRYRISYLQTSNVVLVSN